MSNTEPNTGPCRKSNVRREETDAALASIRQVGVASHKSCVCKKKKKHSQRRGIRGKLSIMDDEGSDHGHDDLSILGRNVASCLTVDRLGSHLGGQLPSRTQLYSLGSTNHHVQGLSLHRRFWSHFNSTIKLHRTVEY